MSLIWILVFIFIIIYNVKRAKNIQAKSRENYERNQNVHASQYKQTQQGYSGGSAGSLQRGVNLGGNVQNNSYEPVYSSTESKMSSSDMELLKSKIRRRNNFNNPVPPAFNPPPQPDYGTGVMQTLNKEEFHAPVMQAGSTGTYSDMAGGQTFSHYDCGHEYNDEIVPEKQPQKKGIFSGMKFDKNEMQKAFVMQEILKRKEI